MSLGKPTRGLTEADLEAECGRGNSLTCFAKNAVFEWHENVDSVQSASRLVRREQICHLARCSYLDPLVVMAVIIIKKRQMRRPTTLRLRA